VGAMTGWSAEELLAPASVHSHWLIVCEGAIGTGAQMERGTSGAGFVIRKEVDRWAASRSCDSRVTLVEEAPWFRIQMEDPWLPQLNDTISFVRCEPTEKGLRYAQPTELERWHLVAHLAADLSRTFNYVRDFSEPDRPWPQFTGMQLELLDVSARGEDARPQPIARFCGVAQEYLPSVLPNLAGAQHEGVMTWLASDLDEDLLPHLEAWPGSCWRADAHGQHVSLSLDPSFRVAQQLGRAPVYGPQFALRLVEETADGVRPLPWSDRSVAVVLHRVRQALERLPQAPPADYEFVGPPRPAMTRGA
jgi:hypothetical protein